MIDRIKITAKTIGEVIYGVRCIPDLAAMLRADAKQNASNEYRIAIHELEVARRKLAERDAMGLEISSLRVELHEQSVMLFGLETECAAAQAERDELRAQLEWLTRWRAQDEEPCLFPSSTFVLWRDNDDDSDACFGTVVSELSRMRSVLWRPTVECLRYYKAERKDAE